MVDQNKDTLDQSQQAVTDQQAVVDEAKKVVDEATPSAIENPKTKWLLIHRQLMTNKK